MIRTSSPSAISRAIQTHLDSAYGEGTTASSTTSVTSSILNYTYENGRRYHAFREGEYILPNDETEQDRLDLVRASCIIEPD